jgi:hypothetical protein
VFGYAFGTALLVNAGEFEIAEAKVLGGMLSRFLVFALVIYYVMPRASRWLTRGRLQTPRANLRTPHMASATAPE